MTHIKDLELIEKLIGQPCERTLACNLIKLRFGCEANPKGISYIWIDPPWEFQSEHKLITESIDYIEDDVEFQNWSKKLGPLNKTVLIGSIFTANKELQLEFEGGYYLYLPYCPNEPNDDEWYEHWYVKTRS